MLDVSWIINLDKIKFMIEDYVCSLELSKQLDQLDVNKKSLFYWSKVDSPIPYVVSNATQSEVSGDFWIPAFTADELLQILPHVLTQDNLKHYRFNLTRSLISVENNPVAFKVNFIINYIEQVVMPIVNDNGEYEWPLFAGQLISKNIYHNKLSDALALTLIYLIEKGLVNVDSRTNR